MARDARYPSAAAWADAEFKVSRTHAPRLSARSLSLAGHIVRGVHPASLAGELGLQRGDILFGLNGDRFDEADIRRSFRARRLLRTHTLDLFRPDTSEHIRVRGSSYPFGLQTSPTVAGFTAALRMGDPDPHDTEQFWLHGAPEELAALWPALEGYNIRLRDDGGRPLDGPLPSVVRDDAPLAGEDWAWTANFTWLALAAAHAGQWERARWVQEAVDAWFERTQSSAMMSMFAAQACVRSMLAEHDGGHGAAVAHMHHAIEMSPESHVLYRRLSVLTGARVDPPRSPHLGTRPQYSLPRHDPKGLFAQPPGTLTLRERTARLEQGELILLCAMSHYRTNGPYAAGFERALMPLTRLRGRIREVHVVTAWSAQSSRDLVWDAAEPALAKAGVDVSVLFDEHDALSRQLSQISAPLNLFIDRTGEVVAAGWLEDDRALWEALGRAA